LRDENGAEARRLRNFVLEEVRVVKAEVRLGELPGSQRDTAGIDIDSHVVEFGEFVADVARGATDLEDASRTGIASDFSETVIMDPPGLRKGVRVPL